MGFALFSDQSHCLYVCMIFFSCCFMFCYIDDDVIVLSTQLHMLMNNDVNLNNVMIQWGELNVLMEKCNYQSKEQCSPMEKLTWYQRWVEQNHGDHPHGDIFDGTKKRMVET